MSKDEHIRRVILELIASDPDGDWRQPSASASPNAGFRITGGMSLPGRLC
jgi:hypothetical protein